MSCKELVELVTHYLDDALSAEDRARFQEHLDDCASCAEYVEQFRKAIQAMGSPAPLEADPVTRTRLLELFREWRR